VKCAFPLENFKGEYAHKKSRVSKMFVDKNYVGNDLRVTSRKILKHFQEKCPVTVYAALYAKVKRDTTNLDWTRNEKEWQCKYGYEPYLQKVSAIYDEKEGEFMDKYFKEDEMVYVFERALLLIETEMNLIRGEPSKFGEFIHSTMFHDSQTILESIQINTKRGLMVIVPSGKQAFLCAIFKDKSEKGLKLFQETARKISKLLKDVTYDLREIKHLLNLLED